MKKLSATLLALVLLLAAAYAGAAWYIGREVEAAIAEPYRQIEALPYVKIIKREYRRGMFTSQESVTFELFGDLMRFMEQSRRPDAGANQPAADMFKPLVFTAVSRIRHGPLPDGKKLAAAIVDTELEVDDRFKPAVAKVLGEKKVLTAHTVYRYEGDGESIISSPAFTTEIAGAGSAPPVLLSWDGVKATMHFTKDFGSYAMLGEAPKLEASAGNGGHLVIAGIRADVENRRVFDDEPLLMSGRQRISIAQASISGPGLAGDGVRIRQVTYDVATPVSGEFLDVIARMAVQEVRVGEANFGPAHYDLTLKHLHARTFAQLNRAMMKMYLDPSAVNPAGGNPSAFDALAKPAMKLLEYGPEITLDRVSFQTPQGEVMVSAHAKLVDAKPEDFKEPAQLIAKLDAGADIALPEGLLMLPLGVKADTPEALHAQLAARLDRIETLAEKGYLQRDGAMVRSKLAFRDGQFTVNGKPFNPSTLHAEDGAPAVVAPAGRPSVRPTQPRREYQPAR